jgi:predicted RNA binding protein YcfA (HicA-like mRNA interferase family)
MPKLYSSKYIISILESKGFVFKSQKGSHCKYVKNDLIVIVPYPKKEIPYGTFTSILKQSGLDKKDFEK